MDKNGQKRYKNPVGVKVREIKLFDIIYGEEDEKLLLKDLKHFEYTRAYDKQGNFIAKIVKKLLKKFLKIHPIDMSNVKPTPFTNEEKKIAPYGSEWFCYVKVLGKLKDVLRSMIHLTAKKSAARPRRSGCFPPGF